MRISFLLASLLCGAIAGCGGDGTPPPIHADTSVDGDGDMSDAGGDGASDTGGDATCDEPCDSPPPAECVDANTRRSWSPAGGCVDGACRYEAEERRCQLPPPSCEGGVATTWRDAACVDGTCVANPETTECAAGCCDDGCCELRPSNASDLGGLGDSELILETPADVVFDTSVCEGMTALGECSAVSIVDGPDVCVCRSRRLRVGGRLKVTGERALALFATESILVRGSVDVSADGPTPGPGVTYQYREAATGSSGGAGGSFGAPGAGDAAPTYGDPSLEPLLGGMNGQDACGGRRGGGGGGALQLSAGVRIEISGTIDASGGGGQGGRAGLSCNGGPGGGSGGAVLIEAPEVTITGRVGANGGGGGGAGMDEAPGAGGRDGNATSGGSGGSAVSCGCALYGYTNGGDGGSGASASGAATPGEGPDSRGGCLGTCVVGAGGAGGGIGRIRVNSASGCGCSGTFSPAATFGAVTLE